MAEQQSLSFQLHDIELAVPRSLVDAFRPAVRASQLSVARVRERLDAELIEAFGKLAPEPEDIEVLDDEHADIINRLVVVMLAMGETAHPPQSRALH